jgi:dihydrofolate reductase
MQTCGRFSISNSSTSDWKITIRIRTFRRPSRCDPNVFDRIHWIDKIQKAPSEPNPVNPVILSKIVVIISIIVAVAENGVIGRGGQLPWRLSSDLRRFKQLTMGHTVIMGRRTWESIGRPLPGRRMVVVSRQADCRTNNPSIHVATSIDEAIAIAEAADDDEAFVIGGAELYRAALPIANRLYLSRILADVPGDTFFPDVDWKEWRRVESEDYVADEANDYPHTFEVYERSE